MSQVFKSRSSPTKLSERDLGESFRTAVIQNETHHVKTLLKKITVDYVLDANRKTALYLASQYGHFKIVKTLLNHGANPNYRCADGSTPVHAACYAASPEVMSLLIDAGGDLRLHDNDGRSVKDWALKHMDKKKARAMICYIEELYQRVMETSEDGDSQAVSPQTSSLKKKLKYPTSSKNAVSLQNVGFGRVRRGQFTYPAQRIRLVEVCGWSEEQSAEPVLVPVITETSLAHDHVGVTFTNGPFMVMESMYWNQFITVTVKRLRKIHTGQPSGRVDELINENNYMLRLKHASILLLLAACPVDRFENIVLVFERVELGSLHMLLHHVGMRFPRKSTCSIFIQICDAVLYIHQSNMIHSYISDHAIMIMSSSHIAKLTNFEYMVDSDANDSSVLVNQTYPAAATKWLAPEILVEKRVSKKTDIYGICVVLWEVLHGRLPFAGLTTAEIEVLLTDAQNRVLPIDAGIETPLKMILDSALKCDPSQRSCKIKDIQDLLEQAYATVKIDKPLQLYKKQARSPFDQSGVECMLGCALYCDQNGELAELPRSEHQRGLTEQREWHNTTLEQYEPGMTALDLENAPEALRHNMRLHKVSAVRKLFKDQVQLDDSSATPMSADEIKRRLLLLNRAETVGAGRDGLGATDGDLAEAESSDKHREVDDLVVSGSGKGGTDSDLPPSVEEVEDNLRDEHGETGIQDDIKDNVPDTDDLRITDIQTDSEEGSSGTAEMIQAAEPIDGEDGGVAADGDNEETEETTETEEVVVEKSRVLGKGNQPVEPPLGETGEGNISPSKCPMYSAVPNGDEMRNTPSSFSGMDVISTEQLPSFPVFEELIVPVKIAAKDILCTFRNEERTETIRENTTSAECSEPGENLKGISSSLITQDSRDAEASESAVLTVQRVRRSILMLKRAFFSNSNLSDGTDPVLSTSAVIAAQTKKSSSDVSLPMQRLKQLSSNSRDLPFDLKLNKRDQPLAALSVDDQLLPRLSGELTADSVEKFKAMINKPLPPLPRTYIKPTPAQRQKSVTNSEIASPEFDSADWQRLGNVDKGAKTPPLLFPRSRQTYTGHYACVTSRVQPAASFSGHSDWQPSGSSAANLRKQRPKSSSHRVREANQPKTESAAVPRPALYSQDGLYAAYMGAPRVYDKTSVDRHCRSPPAVNVDFMTGFKPASHHVPSMVAPHLSKRTNEGLIPEPGAMSHWMPHRRPLRQEDSTGSYIGYRAEKDLRPGVRAEGLLLENDSPPKDMVKGRLERKIGVDMDERDLKEVELMNYPFARADVIPLVSTDATCPKLFALSAQAFQNRLVSDGPRITVKSTQVMSGREATDGKTTSAKVEEVMGDHRIVASKENDPFVSDLEVQDTQRLGANTEPASSGQRTLTRLAAMKAGTSLTVPPSVRISELQEEADFMHRFKSDPLLQRDAVMKLGEKPAKGTELDKTSEEVTQIQQQVSPMTKNVDVEKSNMSEDLAISDGDHAKVFKTSALVCFQMKQSSGGLPDSKAKITKEIEEGVSARDEVSSLVESAIRDALDQISREYLVSKCPHKAISATAGL